MSRFVLDTDILSHLRRGHTLAVHNVLSHAWHDIAVSVISIEEQIDGWYRLLHRSKDPAKTASVYDQMADQVRYLSGWEILSFPVAAISRYQHLKSLKLNIGKDDLKIAAIALENNAILVTRNKRDFSRVPNLQLVDWMQP